MSLPLPLYKCHKQVRAAKIAEVVKHADPDPGADDAVFEASPHFQGAHLFLDGIYGPVAVDAAWYRKHQPKKGGYYVLYQGDGYASFSPAEAFESGYTRVEF